MMTFMDFTGGLGTYTEYTEVLLSSLLIRVAEVVWSLLRMTWIYVSILRYI